MRHDRRVEAKRRRYAHWPTAARHVATAVTLSLAACDAPGPTTRFAALGPDATGIHFANRIAEDDTFNILTLEYVYNGGGVGVGDFDADGRPDLYFTANTAANALYLNRGDFSFEDVTEAAGVTAGERWSSGVAVADVNADGLDDIYVCATVLQPMHRRANLLYINEGPGEDGVPRFRESAAAYGIADTSHTTAAAFLDYDLDGDLDLYVLVNHMDDKRFPNRFGARQLDGTSTRNDVLYRNDGLGADGHPVFSDATAEAGITEDGYGLGVAVCDLDADGWPDVYVANDYLSPDFAWINQRDGTFRDASADMLQHTSYSAMGIDVADLNGDARPDIVTLDMLPATNRRRKTMIPAGNFTTRLNYEAYDMTYQYMRNVLQLNRGRLTATDSLPAYSEIGLYAGIAATDWSWSVLAADIDLDADRDLLITNGFPKDITDLDFMDYSSSVSRYSSRRNLLAQIPSVEISNQGFANDGRDVPRFTDATENWGLRGPSFSNGAATVDLDGDGDLDYVINCINDSALVYKNTTLDDESTVTGRTYVKVSLQGEASNTHALGATVRVVAGGRTQAQYNSPYRGYLSSVDPDLHFGLDTVDVVDSLVVTWPGGGCTVMTGVASGQRVIVRQAGASGTACPAKQWFARPTPYLQDVTQALRLDGLAHDEDIFPDFDYQRLLPRQLSQAGPALAVGDANGDGLDDLLIGGAFGRPDRLVLQRADATFAAPVPLDDDEIAYAGETTSAVFFDADGDGDEDLYLARGSVEARSGDASYRDAFYRQTAGGLVRDTTALPSLAVSTSVARVADVDGDGDLDVFAGGRSVPAVFPRAEPSSLLLNDGTGRFRIARLPQLDALGMVTDALLVDVTGDRLPDLITAEDFGPVRVLPNDGRGFSDSEMVLIAPEGCYTSLLAHDGDGDGDLDLVAGNLGLNHLFHDGGREHLLRVYAGDFDGNGYADIFPAARFIGDDGQRDVYPYFQRQEMEKQFPMMKAKYVRHADLAAVTAPEMIAGFGGGDSLTVEASQLASAQLVNDGAGGFSESELPRVAQLAPLAGMASADVNGDGHVDLLVSGNDHGVEQRMGRYDAMFGQVLLGDGQGNYEPVPPLVGGLSIRGDAKALVQILLADGRLAYVSSVNDGPVRAFAKTQHAGPGYRKATSTQTTVSTPNGAKAIPYGMGLASASGRYVLLDE